MLRVLKKGTEARVRGTENRAKGTESRVNGTENRVHNDGVRPLPLSHRRTSQACKGQWGLGEGVKAGRVESGREGYGGNLHCTQGSTGPGWMQTG